ncbi:hypothetical protein SAMN05877838_3193 [Hoeflea halophila]|uniref:Uncharacterized protein n=1 Tax=Hoeflea halophila TaxID=714899 RepID=A0A286IDX0_9HYPH|nr:hypothetical protein [Hoeflea halophila]SOE18272.1 hypothetical protein SAMN05877838_3193 [Hoeflea halophila]
MGETLFEIENWRGGWYYKLGSRYTGPFNRRDAAVAAGRAEIDPLLAPGSSSLRASLARQCPLTPEYGAMEQRERAASLGMTFRLPGIGGYT